MTMTIDDVMGLDSANRWGDEPTEPEFKVPGDFRRTGRNGPPRVSSPDPNAKITKSGERKGRPELVTYGRPSGYAETCEPKERGYGKQKWAERCLINGFGRDPSLPTRAGELARAATSINVSHQDPEWRKKADGIFKAAFRAGGGEIASSRGTHIHTLIEDEINGISWACKVAAGHDLGLPTDVQTAMVDAFQQCCADNGLTILGTELKLINDRLRLAGSADYIVELSRPLDFIHEGEVVTLDTEGAKIGDAKTGHLGIGYLVSMAAYAESCLYDTEAEVRLPMPWEIDQQWGLIFHVPVVDAMEGRARCDLVLVDLEHGRRMANLTLGMIEAHERGPRFAPRFITDVPRAESEVVASSEPRRETAPCEEHVADGARQRLTHSMMRHRMSTMDSTNDPFDGLVESSDLAWGDEIASAEFRSYIAERTVALFKQSPTHAKAAAARIAAAGIPKLSEFAAHTNAQIQQIEHEVAMAESAAAAETSIAWTVSAPPVGQLDERRALTDAEYTAALDAYKALDDTQRATVNAWAIEAEHSGFGVKLSDARTLRRLRNLELRIALADVDPDMARAAIAYALDADWPHLPTIPFGAVLAGLTIPEVEHLLKFATSLADVEYRFDGRGVLVLAA